MIRRSIVTKNDLEKGHNIKLEDIKFARPGSGISTNEFKYMEGRKLNIDVPAENYLKMGYVYLTVISIQLFIYLFDNLNNLKKFFINVKLIYL